MRIPDIPLKTSIDVARIRRASRTAESVLKALHGLLRPGMSTMQVDGICADLIDTSGCTPALRGYRGFTGCICTSVNAVAAHGVPGAEVLREGDIVTIDLTVEYDGWYSDAAWTYVIGSASPEARRLVKTAWQSLLAGILAARAGGRIGDIGAAVKRTAERNGCAVLEDFAGHGIGRSMHEEPVVLHTGTPGMGMPIVPGMVFTIEPVLCLGTPEYRLLEDGWSCRTSDGSLAAQFEHTIAVFRDRTEILTSSHGNIRRCLDFPPVFE
jgi:methionyl aminopeptidase